MTAIPAHQAYKEIIVYIEEHGGAFRNWYVGIATDARLRMFEDHKVDEKEGAWIVRICISDASARKVEEDLIKLGCDGSGGGGNVTTVEVYAYLKTAYTEP